MPDVQSLPHIPLATALLNCLIAQTEFPAGQIVILLPEKARLKDGREFDFIVEHAGVTVEPGFTQDDGRPSDSYTNGRPE